MSSFVQAALSSSSAPQTRAISTVEYGKSSGTVNSPLFVRANHARRQTSAARSDIAESARPSRNNFSPRFASARRCRAASRLGTAFRCGARLLLKLSEQGHLRTMLSRCQLQGFVMLLPMLADTPSITLSVRIHLELIPKCCIYGTQLF
jgi:hypothetical protein